MLSPFDSALEVEVKALFAGCSLDDLKHGRVTLLDIDLLFQAKQFEMSQAARPQLEMMMQGISGKSLAEAEAKEADNSEAGAAQRAKDKVLEERGAVLKAELRQRLEFSFLPDFLRARHVRAHGWPGEDEQLEPIPGVSRETARAVWQLAQDGKLSAFNEVWKQLQNADDYRRLEITAGIKRGD